MNGLDVLHIARRFVFIARLVAAYGAHLIVVVVVLVRVLGSILASELLHILCSDISTFLLLCYIQLHIPFTFAS
jgi:hypothetical protein